jgi:hypothetical protein
MGWTNSHVHDFEIAGVQYGDPQLLDDGFETVKCKDSTKTLLSKILPANGQRCTLKYTYDFGDCWEHEEYASTLQWLGGWFDPDEFDVSTATKSMHKGIVEWRTSL